MNIKKIKKRTYFNLLLWLLVIIFSNIIASYIYTRIDLTSEKRYTLSKTTVEMLENLDDVIYIEVYLEGDLNAGFKRLRNNTKEMLDEFKVYAKDNLEYEFKNPIKDKDQKTQNEILLQLKDKGLIPTNIQEQDADGKMSQQILIPGALVQYRNNEVAVDLLKNNKRYTAEQNLNNSAQETEYEFIKAFSELQKERKSKIGIIEGHGELNELYMTGALDALAEQYSIEILSIEGQLNSLRERVMVDSTKSEVRNRYDLIIIARPDTSFTKYDQFIIDQYIMYGGKVLWLVEGTTADTDSLRFNGSFMAFVNDLNINPQLFKYGARVNPDIIQDIQCGVLPINTSYAGAKPNFVPMPWLYFPLIAPSNNHPITKNMDVIKTQFVSTIDAVGENPNVKKTYLLFTSEKTKVLTAPVRVSLDIIGTEPDTRQFAKSNQPVAILLEGKFESFFNNHLDQNFADNDLISFQEESKPTKMIIVADGDIIRNPIIRRGGQYIPLPLGSDEWFENIYYGGNLEFILNSVNYLLDDQGVMSVRTRELKLRLMDRLKVKDEKLKWQMINILVPVMIIIVFGLLLQYFRKRKNIKLLTN
ncbi:MAG: gliding motility-associated ABC transporter substrate-binding protein GldG [Bacteroidota bacterium]